jgi:hypothetical protein
LPRRQLLERFLRLCPEKTLGSKHKLVSGLHPALSRPNNIDLDIELPFAARGRMEDADDAFLDLLDQLVENEPDEVFGGLPAGVDLPFSDLDWPQPQQGQPAEHSTSLPSTAAAAAAARPPAAQQQQQQQQPSAQAAATAPSLDAAWQAAQPLQYTSPAAQTQYTNTTALVAAAQAQMDATPGHNVQLQHVVSATSYQLQQMAQRAALLVASKAPAQPAAAGAAAQFSMPPPAPQQQSMAMQQQQSMPMPMQQQHQAVPMQQQQDVSLQQQQRQQHRQQQRQTAATPFSAATIAKAAAIASSSSAAAAAPAPTPQVQQPFGLAAAQGAGLQATPAAAAAAGGFLQRPSSLTGALSNSSVLDLSLAAAAAAAAAAGQQQQQQQQQQGLLGLALPDHFKGVMLTPAGAVTGKLLLLCHVCAPEPLPAQFPLLLSPNSSSLLA